MYKVGHIIKEARRKAGMKQVVLANGICTTSYISKIERNATTPSEEILNLLLDRLNISKESLYSTGQETLDQLKSIYFELTAKRNKSIIKENKDFLHNSTFNFSLSSDYFSAQLYLSRISLANKDFTFMEKLLVSMSANIDSFSVDQKYLYYKHAAVYYYQKELHMIAIENYVEAEKYLQQMVSQDWERADFNYLISLAFLETSQLSNSINYASEALQFFSNKLYFNRAIECYLVKGIAYKRVHQYKQAFETYQLAKKLTQTVEIHEYDGLLFQNIGSLHSLQGDSITALKYYEESLKIKTTDKEKLVSLLSIVNEYSKLKNSSQVLIFCAQALNILRSKTDSNFKSFTYKFEIYQAYHSENINFQVICTDAIKYFERISDFKSTHKFSLLLADYFYATGKYKDSSFFYRKASEMNFKIQNLYNWEDLQ